MPNVRSCWVRVRDVEGTLHTVDVTAESLYEAAALALRAFRAEPWMAALPPNATLDVAVTSPVVRHSVSLAAVERWLREPPKSPQEKLRKQLG